MKFRGLLFPFCILFFLTISCGISNGIYESENSESSPTIVDDTTTPIKTSTLIISRVTPSSTQIPATVTMDTLMPSSTSTTIPTLSIVNARNRMIDLLATNGGCHLPCLFGITPDKSTYQEARMVLMPLSSISVFTAFSPGIGNIAPNFYEGDLIISINIDLLTNGEIVNKVAFEARALREMTKEQGVMGVFDSKKFGDRLSLYILPQILSQYGRPSAVMITTLAEPPPQTRGGDIGYFRIILLYPEQGISIRYITNIKNIGENVVGCLANAHVEMELYSSGNGNEFMDNLDPAWKEDIKDNYKPLEEVTSMSIDDFYQIFRQPTDKCIETPSILWPVPEK